MHYVCDNCRNSPKPGDVRGTGTVGIGDALEILKFLAGLPSMVDEKDNLIGYKAAILTEPSRLAQKPSIHDALEILKYLAGLPNRVDFLE